MPTSRGCSFVDVWGCKVNTFTPAFFAKSKASRHICDSWLSITEIQGFSFDAFVCLIKCFMTYGKIEEFIHPVGKW